MSGNGENKGAAGEEDPNTITLKISGDERLVGSSISLWNL